MTSFQLDYQTQLKYKEESYNEFNYGILKTLQYDNILAPSMQEFLQKRDFKSFFEIQDPIVPLVKILIQIKFNISFLFNKYRQITTLLKQVII